MELARKERDFLLPSHLFESFKQALTRDEGRETKTMCHRSKTPAAMTSTILGLQVIKDNFDETLRGSKQGAARHQRDRKHAQSARKAERKSY